MAPRGSGDRGTPHRGARRHAHPRADPLGGPRRFPEKAAVAMIAASGDAGAMQLDLFRDSRQVVLRNAAIEALRARDLVAAADAIRALECENGGDAWSHAFSALHERLRRSIAPPLDR